MRSLFSIILLTTVIAVFGQELGIRGGWNLATTGGDTENVLMKSAYHIGLFSSGQTSNNLVYYFDATYSRQGGAVDPRVVKDFKINNNYINLTSLVGFKASDRLSFLLGPQLGIRLNGRVRWPGFFDENTTEDLSLLNLALASAFQYHLNDRTRLYTRYAHGLTYNVSKEATNDGEFPDRVIQIGIAVNIVNID